MRSASAVALFAFLTTWAVTGPTWAGAGDPGGALALVDRDDPAVDPASPEALGWTPEQHRTARLYARTGWTLAILDPLWTMAALALLVFTGFAARAAAFTASRLRSRLAADVSFIVILVTALAVLGFPIEALRFWRESAFGFANQGVGPWFLDLCKGLVVAWVIAAMFLTGVWACIRRWPRSWWVLGSALGVAGSILMIMVAPVFIAPLFNTFAPLADDGLRERILALAHDNGIPADEVYTVDASRQSSHDNAYVAGLLGTQRIVLYDTLLAAYAPEEIEFVMGHEMGHYILNHVWKGTAFAALVIVAGFFLLHRTLGRTVTALAPRLGYATLSSIAAVPLFLLFVAAFLFLIQPLSSGVSRHFERQADAFALRTLDERGIPRAVGMRSFQKMAARNLSDPDPPAWIEWWLYSHPAIGKRIRACAAAAGRN
jgi:STE24 endopeptidase